MHCRGFRESSGVVENNRALFIIPPGTPQTDQSKQSSHGNTRETRFFGNTICLSWSAEVPPRKQGVVFKTHRTPVGTWLHQLKRCCVILCSVALPLVLCLLGRWKQFPVLPISRECDPDSVVVLVFLRKDIPRVPALSCVRLSLSRGFAKARPGSLLWAVV